jgi:hypothetical protein
LKYQDHEIFTGSGDNPDPTSPTLQEIPINVFNFKQLNKNQGVYRSCKTNIYVEISHGGDTV